MNIAHLATFSFFDGASPAAASDTFAGNVSSGALAFFDGFTGTDDAAVGSVDWLIRFGRRAKSRGGVRT